MGRTWHKNLIPSFVKVKQPPSWLPQFLDDHMELDRDTGRLKWGSTPPSNRVKPFSDAGHYRANGHHLVKIKGHQFYGSQLAYYLRHGTWPVGAVRFLRRAVGYVDGNYWDAGRPVPDDIAEHLLKERQGKISRYTPEEDLALDAMHAAKAYAAGGYLKFDQRLEDADSGGPVHETLRKIEAHYRDNLGLTGDMSYRAMCDIVVAMS